MPCRASPSPVTRHLNPTLLRNPPVSSSRFSAPMLRPPVNKARFRVLYENLWRVMKVYDWFYEYEGKLWWIHWSELCKGYFWVFHLELVFGKVIPLFHSFGFIDEGQLRLIDWLESCKRTFRVLLIMNSVFGSEYVLAFIRFYLYEGKVWWIMSFE